MVNYPPYVDAYGQIKELFKRIKEAQVPQKFTNDFIYSILGLKSTSYRAMIPLLKRVEFIDENSVPTTNYRDYRDDQKSKVIMAKAVKKAYKDLFAINEYAYQLKKEEIITKLVANLGTSKDDQTIPKVAATFLVFCGLSNFSGKIPTEEKPESPTPLTKMPSKTIQYLGGDSSITNKLGVSYTINLNLPATQDIEVFNSIFKSLKEHLLK